MRDNSYDRTIERNYLQKWRFLIPEYEAVKAGPLQVSAAKPCRAALSLPVWHLAEGEAFRSSLKARPAFCPSPQNLTARFPRTELSVDLPENCPL